MKVNYPLRLFFDCGAAHLSPAGRPCLKCQVSPSGAFSDSWTAKTPFGWFVWADDELRDAPSSIWRWSPIRRAIGRWCSAIRDWAASTASRASRVGTTG